MYNVCVFVLSVFVADATACIGCVPDAGHSADDAVLLQMVPPDKWSPGGAPVERPTNRNLVEEMRQTSLKATSDECCSPTGSGCHPWPCAESYGIPRANTVRRGSVCGVESPNYPNLAECAEPLSKGMDVSNIRPYSDTTFGNLTFLTDVHDARGHWKMADGNPFEEYIEQCGNRFTQTHQVIHDFIHADGTPEGGCRDYYGQLPACVPMHVRGAWATSELLNGDPCFVMIELDLDTLADKRIGAVRCLQKDGTLKFFNGKLHPSYDAAWVLYRQPDSCTNCDIVPTSQGR